MPPTSLASLYQGWDGYRISLVNAIKPLTPEQLAFRPAPDLRSVGELAKHIGCGRLTWFRRMDAPLSAKLVESGKGYTDEPNYPTDAPSLIRLLEDTGQMVEATLNEWTVADLEKSFHHIYWGKTYLISRHWVLWRILSHDLHHGGQLCLALYMQGIEPPELGLMGGHLTEPPVVEPGEAA